MFTVQRCIFLFTLSCILCSQYIYIDIYVCVCVRLCVREKIKRRKKENGDRCSANGISSPFSIEILVLKNQCFYSVGYGFVEH